MNRPDFPRIDAHAHYFYDRPFLAPLLEEWNLRAVLINVASTPGLREPMQARWRAMVAMKEKYPDRFWLCTTFDAEPVGEAEFAERVIRRLEEDFRQGAALVKVWKNIGLDLRDRDGSFVQIDDARFQPIWDFLAGREVPVVAHLAEPVAAWLPLDPRSPHYRYYSANPDYHIYHRPDLPRWEEVIRARDRWVERNPELTIIGAHLGSMEHDTDLVAERLDRYPNFYVDTAERFGDLAMQPSKKVREFFIRYQDRILYGTDILVERKVEELTEEEQREEESRTREQYTSHWDYLVGSGTIPIADKLLEPVRVEALDLPGGVVRKLYFHNAARLLGEPSVAESNPLQEDHLDGT